MQERQKQSFTDVLSIKMTQIQNETGGFGFIVAYCDGNFGLSTKGMDGSGSTDKRLMIQLPKTFEW